MASRYVSSGINSYCFNPVHIVDKDKDIIVPCGKCDGCRLHKANEWSMRLVREIEFNTYSIFFTLTYNNYFLPKLQALSQSELGYHYTSQNDFNVRFDGKKVVFRKDDIELDYSKSDVKIQNYGRRGFIPYASKRDIQLWLKLLRKDIDFYFPQYETELRHFRYYIISEYGPSTFRPHFHGIIFPKESEIAEWLMYVGMFKNWQMCDKDLFDQYTRFCDTGTAGYVTQYITSVNHLPQVYRSESIKPFRLASKSPSIGFVSFDPFEVSQKVSTGIIEYIKEVARLESHFVLRFPKDYMRSLFPKCYQYNLLTSGRIYEIYSTCFLDVKRRSTAKNTWVSFARLRAFMHPMNYNASLKCYKFCMKYNVDPHYYVYCLDMYYYKASMAALKYFYESMSNKSSLEIAYMYDNFGYLLSFRGLQSRSLDVALEVFIYSLGLQFCDFDKFSSRSKLSYNQTKLDYIDSVEDVIINSAKMPKFNEKYGLSPHIV